MANTLTALAPVLFSAAQIVAGEPFGAIDAINKNFDDKGVAVGDNVKVTVAPVRAASDFTPSNATSTGTDATATAIDVTISKSRKVSWNLTGEQIRSLDNGAGAEEWIRQLAAQGMRTLRNEAETDCLAALKAGASRATGTAGTNPFATNINPLADVRKILRDNGAPASDMQLVMDTTSEANLLKLGIVNSAEQAGSDEERRSGLIKRQMGFQMRASGMIGLHTKGAATGALINNGSTEAVGETTLTLDTITVNTTGILAGDIVTFAVDSTNKYVVNTGLVATSGNIVIGNPGVRIALPDNNAMTIGNNYTPNFAFERDAIVGVMRPPLIPANPTINQMLITDQFGMTYLMLDIAQYGQRSLELHLAWGFKVVQSEFVAILLG